jgi:parallel beta-helix repeat protein
MNRASRVSARSPRLQAGTTRAQRRRGWAAAAVGGVLLSLFAAAPAGADSTGCDKVASPLGSDAASGSPDAPLRSAQALVDALAPGQVGCLRAGTYGGGLRIDHGGAPAAPIVLRSYPGEHALITGRVYVPAGSDWVTIAALSLDGNYQSESPPLPSPSINANHVTFEADDVTNDHTEICFDIGSSEWGTADSTVISGNHIHDCGVLPSRNEDHGVYVQDATNTRIVGNLIDRNSDRGIQLYPSSMGAVIADNVISEDGEGVSFSGEGGVASSDNVVEHNLIVNSLIRSDVESWYPAGNPRGVGNVVRANCVSARGIDPIDGGFSASSNVTASPDQLVATGDGGYLPATGSACANVLPSLTTAPAPAALARHTLARRARGPSAHRRHNAHWRAKRARKLRGRAHRARRHACSARRRARRRAHASGRPRHGQRGICRPRARRLRRGRAA